MAKVCYTAFTKKKKNDDLSLTLSAVHLLFHLVLTRHAHFLFLLLVFVCLQVFSACRPVDMFGGILPDKCCSLLSSLGKSLVLCMVVHLAFEGERNFKVCTKLKAGV